MNDGKRIGLLGGLAESDIEPRTISVSSSVVFNPDALYLSFEDVVMGYR